MKGIIEDKKELRRKKQTKQTLNTKIKILECDNMRKLKQEWEDVGNRGQ